MSGNASYDRSPEGFFRNLVSGHERVARRLPPQVLAAAGMTPPVVNEHVPVVVRSTPPNTTNNSWYGSGTHVDFITMEATASGVLDDAAMAQIRQYPYAIYSENPEGGPYLYAYDFWGLQVSIYKGDTVDQDYPGLGDPGGDNDSDYVYTTNTYWGGDDAFTVNAGDKLTLVLIWWQSWRDVDAGQTVSADVGGLVFAVNAVLAGVDLNALSWRSTTFPETFIPSFEVGASGYFKQDPGRFVEVGEGAHAEGLGTFADGDAAHAEGMATQAVGDASHSEGESTVAVRGAHSEGRFTQATAMWAHSEGEETRATDMSAHAEGYQAQAGGRYSHAEGTGRVMPGAILAHAEGSYTKAHVPYSHVEGAGTESHRYHEHADGGKWGSVHLLSASRVSGPGYATNTTTSGYMMIPRIFIGQQEIMLTQGRATRMEIIVVGIAANESVMASWRILGLAYLPTAGSARVAGTPTVTKEFGDAGTSTWSVSIAVTATGQVRVTTNSNGTSARWSGLYHFTEVPFDDLHM